MWVGASGQGLATWVVCLAPPTCACPLCPATACPTQPPPHPPACSRPRGRVGGIAQLGRGRPTGSGGGGRRRRQRCRAGRRWAAGATAVSAQPSAAGGRRCRPRQPLQAAGRRRRQQPRRRVGVAPGSRGGGHRSQPRGGAAGASLRPRRQLAGAAPGVGARGGADAEFHDRPHPLPVLHLRAHLGPAGRLAATGAPTLVPAQQRSSRGRSTEASAPPPTGANLALQATFTPPRPAFTPPCPPLQVLFFGRISSDVLGRFLPRLPALAATSPLAPLAVAGVKLLGAGWVHGAHATTALLSAPPAAISVRCHSPPTCPACLFLSSLRRRAHHAALPKVPGLDAQRRGSGWVAPLHACRTHPAVPGSP